MLMRVAPGRRTRHADGLSVTWSDKQSIRTRSRRRDRRGRGIRGPLAPRAVPISRSRASRFDEQVLLAWDRLIVERPELQYIELAVSDVPEPTNPALSVFDPADAGLSARITVYRWAMELRAADQVTLQRLLRDVLAEQAASFLGTSPEALDPEYGRG